MASEGGVTRASLYTCIPLKQIIKMNSEGFQVATCPNCGTTTNCGSLGLQGNCKAYLSSNKGQGGKILR
jgi:hypothetical protein